MLPHPGGPECAHCRLTFDDVGYDAWCDCLAQCSACDEWVWADDIERVHGDRLCYRCADVALHPNRYAIH